MFCHCNQSSQQGAPATPVKSVPCQESFFLFFGRRDAFAHWKRDQGGQKKLYSRLPSLLAQQLLSPLARSSGAGCTCVPPERTAFPCQSSVLCFTSARQSAVSTTAAFPPACWGGRGGSSTPVLVFSHDCNKPTRGQGRSVKEQSELSCPWGEILHLRKDPALCFLKGSWDRLNLLQPGLVQEQYFVLQMPFPPALLSCHLPASTQTLPSLLHPASSLVLAPPAHRLERHLSLPGMLSPAVEIWEATPRDKQSPCIVHLVSDVSDMWRSQRALWLSLSSSPWTAKCMRIVQGRNYLGVVMEEQHISLVLAVWRSERKWQHAKGLCPLTTDHGLLDTRGTCGWRGAGLWTTHSCASACVTLELWKHSGTNGKVQLWAKRYCMLCSLCCVAPDMCVKSLNWETLSGCGWRHTLAGSVTWSELCVFL